MIDPAMAVIAALAIDSVRTNGTSLSLGVLRSSLRSAVDEDPMQAALVTVLGSSVLFYLAERGHNPKVVRFEDALVYCTTCFDVGYGEVTAKTPTGKAIASALQTFGPALVAKIFDPTRRETEAKEAELARVQRAIADNLGAILDELRQQRA